MARKIENPLTTGLPSKIYLLCYLNRESGYSLAQKIYPDKKYMATSKIYGWTKRLVKGGYLERFREEERFEARVQPLVEMISEAIANQGLGQFALPSDRLDEKEKQAIAKLLNSVEFKRLLEPSTKVSNGKDIPQRLFRNSTEDVNAYQLIVDALSFLGAITYMSRNLEDKLPFIDEQISEGHFQPSNWKENARKHNEVVRLIDKLPDSLLNKIARLMPTWSSMASNLLYDAWQERRNKGEWQR